jgi:hypothetical protein
VDIPPTPVPVDVANEADALIDATSPDAASYVFAEDYCRTSPIYPPGTQIVLPRAIVLSIFDLLGYLPDSSVNGRGRVLSYLYLPNRPYLYFSLPAGTVVEITGPYVEHGVCDLWPIRFRKDGLEEEAYVDEWDLSPEFPNQVAPLPPERQFITREMEAFCLSDPEITQGAVMVLAHDAPLFSYDRGYPFEFKQTIPAGTEIEINGLPVETGVCSMWRVTARLPNPDYIPPTERSDPVTGPVTIAEFEEIGWDGYMFEPDLRPEGG